MLLYKYLTPERIDVLHNKSIRLTQINQLNDPFEYIINVSADKETMAEYLHKHRLDELKTEVFRRNPYLKQIENTIDWKNQIEAFCTHDTLYELIHWENVLENVINKISTHGGVLSMTEDRNNKLMWSHYAMEHTGFIVGFDTSTPMIEGGVFKPVSYQEETVRMHFTKVEEIEDVRTHAKSKDKEYWMSALYIKSIDWSYEKEWRLTGPFSLCKEVKPLVYLLPFNPRSVKEIILGCRISTKTEKEIRNLLDNDEQLKHVELYKAKKDPRKFELIIEAC